MASLPLRREVAAKWTRIAQIGIGVAVALVIVAFRLPAPEVETEAARVERETPQPVEAPERSHPTDSLGEQDYTGMVAEVDALSAPLVEQWRIDQERLREAQLAKQAEEEAAEEKGETAQGPLEGGRQGGFPPPWRYLGAISEGDRMTALLVIDGQQVFASTGYTKDGYEVLGMTMQQLRVKQGRSEHVLDLESSARGADLQTTSADGGGGRSPVDIRNEDDGRRNPRLNPGDRR